VLAQVPDQARPAAAPGSRTTAPVPTPSAPPTDARTPVETAAGGPDSRSPFDDLAGPDDGDKAPSRADVANAPAPAPGAADPQVGARAPAGPAAEPPLPSLEETERQIREEAARARQENGARLAQQREDLRAIRDEERRQFLDELQMVLKVHGKRAGPEIERLSQRTGRKEDPMLLARARWVIAESKTSPRGKVRQLRALGVPETVILDYLANRLDRNVGTRDGPRSRDEVWVQAARLLVIYSSETPRPPAADEPAGRTTHRPVGSQQSGGGAARPR
jgi:hypothetical protein